MMILSLVCLLVFNKLSEWSWFINNLFQIWKLLCFHFHLLHFVSCVGVDGGDSDESPKKRFTLFHHDGGFGFGFGGMSFDRNKNLRNSNFQNAMRE